MTADTRVLQERIHKALTSQRPKTITVLSSLLAVFDELGYIPPQAIEGVAQFTHTTVNDVWGVASFYTNFRFTPPGRHQVEVCWGPTCHIVGAQAVARAVLEELGIENEGDSADGRASLRFNTCLGACAQAPVISVDHQLLGRMTPEQARQALARLNGHAGGPLG